MSYPLELPVIIPQQRPGSKDRGFMAAYSPYLEACGVDQRTFLHFIDECNTALQGNKYLAGVQVVSFGVGLTPELIVMGVSAAVSAGAYMANKSFVKHKTNLVLDKYNAEVFGPRGLFCMIMKYDPVGPDSQDQQRYGGPDIQSPNQSGGFGSMLKSAIGSNGRGSTLTRNHISGSTSGAQGLPAAVAPLIYMDDRRQLKDYLAGGGRHYGPDVDRTNGSDYKKPSAGNKAKKAFENLNDYLDRRARARYAAENEGDVLNVPLSRRFGNRYLDPNHEATNGGLMGMLSGGLLTQDPETRRRKAVSRIEEEERRVYEDFSQRMDSIRNQNQSRREIERQLRRCEEDHAPQFEAFRQQKMEAETEQRSIKSGVLYLAIVNRPSPEEVAATTAKLDRERRRGVVFTESV